MYSLACGWMTDSLLEARPRASARDRRLLAGLVAALRAPLRPTRQRAPERELARRLVSYTRRHPARRGLITDRLRYSGRFLAREGFPPPRGARAVAWRALIEAAAHLHESRVRRLPSRCVDAGLLDALRREGRARQPRSRARRTQYAAPGRWLNRLAVDRQLQRAAGRAIGLRLVPTGVAVYMYDPPRSHVPPHLDSEAYEVIVHVVLEHVAARDAARSALVVYGPDREVRMALGPGQGVVLAGRGAVHQWEPLGSGERRMLIGIGFQLKATT